MIDSSSGDTESNAVLNNIVFIIVKPVYLGNIGAVARAMKNFALSDLRLVSPPKNYKDAEARKMAVGAFDILKNASVFESLEDALKDVAVSVGTTSGKQRKLIPAPLAEISPSLLESANSNKVAFILGDERDGLRQEDLNRCHHIVTIPTSEALPSLNLAQAACIIGYELSRSGNNFPRSTRQSGDELSTGANDDELLQLFGQLSDSVNFSRTFNRQIVQTEFRQLWQRTHPTKREADLLKGILIRLNQHLAAKPGQSSNI
ncbi:MAG TPA: RNA methyltransferase [Candidatus Melainabacteria bacterium]|jgi:TrmH family RNA methyltransferase|nr:RNA methyltransferase [Candidatus Melainabacteria bacterium]HIN64606.1 RNA methyltransferase [Candidatus Obscuribacterales bacterium]